MYVSRCEGLEAMVYTQTGTGINGNLNTNFTNCFTNLISVSVYIKLAAYVLSLNV